MVDSVVSLTSRRRRRTAGQPNQYLYTEQAQEELAHMLTSVAETDETLTRVGLQRRHLRALESDDEITSALDTRSEAAISSPWRVESSPDSGEAGEALAVQMHDLLAPHMETLMRSAWEALPFGYSVCELVYADVRPYTLDRVSIKPFEWFTPRRDGQLVFHGTDTGGTGDVFVPYRVDVTHEDPLMRIPKFMFSVRQPTYREPRGKPLLARLYWAWFFREKGWGFWSRFLERHGSPLLVGGVTRLEGEQPDDYDQRVEDMLDVLVQAVNSAVAAIDGTDRIEAVNAGTDGNAYSLFDDAVNKRVQKVVLGQTLTSDVTKAGSYAASKTHNLVREDRRDADLRMMRRPIQQIVDALTVLNYGPETPSPTVIIERERGVQIDRAERDTTLTRAGVRFTKNYFLRHYDFEDDEIEMVEPQGDAAPGAAPALMLPTGVTLSQATDPLFLGAARGQNAIDALIGNALANAPAPLEADAVRMAIEGASDPEALLEALMALVPRDLEASDELRDLFERALFAADVMGYAHSETQG